MQGGKRSERAELLAVVLLGLLLRLFAGRTYITEMGVLLPGYDEYYHMRRILYTVQNFPQALWFDSYLNYPYGLRITWPPLFDQISAALCLAAGQHGQRGVEIAASMVPPLIGIMAIVVVYLTIREVLDSKAALLAGFMTAIAPYYFLYTIFGSADHHCLEVLLWLSIALLMTLSLTRGRLAYALLAGLTMAALAYTWQGADVYIGLLLVFAAVRISLDLRERRGSEETTRMLLAAFGLALLLVTPFGGEEWMRPSFIGLAAMTAAIVVMYALSRLVVMRGLPWQAFPGGLLLLFIVFLVLSSLTGGLFGVGPLIASGVRYFWGGEMLGKIAEAEPLIYDADTFRMVIFSGLGPSIILSIAGIAAALRALRRSEGGRRSGLIILLIWTASSIILTFGQTRFLYISTIAMGVLASMLFLEALRLAEGRLQGQRLQLFAAALLLIIVLPAASDTIRFAADTPPQVAGDWYTSLVWLRENSPATSFFESPSRAAEYSVMSWWDYGNWILYLTRRPVVANNFQAGYEDAATFYLSEEEREATEVLDRRGSRYILTDFGLVYGKLPALTTWAGKDISDYMTMEAQGGRIEATPTRRLYNTTMARLYLFDGSGMGRFRLIYESPTLVGSNPPKSQVKIFEYVPGALIRVRAGPEKRAGALLNMTSNQGRSFTYINEALPVNGAFEMRVPYSTEGGAGTHATGPYMVFAGDRQGVTIQSLNVSEEDVLHGRTLEVAL